MIRALLEGRKTQTRRIAKRGNSTVLGLRWGPKSPWSGLLFDHPEAVAHDPHISVPFLRPEDEERGGKWEDDQCMYRVRPIWEVGDRLWVRETFSECPLKTYYRATEKDPLEIKWIPSILMPRRASRLTLKVTGVKAERLQDIGVEDAIAEGVEAIRPASIGAFSMLWDSIHGTGAWTANPWVYALTFETYKCNIDARTTATYKLDVIKSFS